MTRTKKTPLTFEEIAGSEKLRRMLGEHAIVVFHSPEQGAVSPGVSNFWKPPVVDLLVEAGSHFTTNDVNAVCARFIGWCFTRPDLDTFVLKVHSVPTPPGGFDPEDQEARYAGIMAELAACHPPPVLVNIDIYDITRAGQVLWRPGAEAVSDLMEIVRGTTRDEDYKKYEDRVNRAENPYAEARAIFFTGRKVGNLEPSSADAEPVKSNPPDSPRSQGKKGKAKKGPPRR
jgi:hypothetical protein